jgi:hypothetical protein
MALRIPTFANLGAYLSSFAPGQLPKPKLRSTKHVPTFNT